MSGSPRILIAFTLATAIVVGAIIAVTTDFWWALAIAVLIHFATTAFVLAFLSRRMSQQDKPDPITEARIEAGRGARA